MPGYDSAQKCMYNFDEFTFGAAVATKTVKITGPVGKQGRIKDAGIVVSVATVWTSTHGKMNIGTTATPTAYGVISVPTAKAADTIVNFGNAVANAGAITLQDVPADSVVTLQFVEGVGGSIAGKGYPYVIIDWY